MRVVALLAVGLLATSGCGEDKGDPQHRGTSRGAQALTAAVSVGAAIPQGGLEVLGSRVQRDATHGALGAFTANGTALGFALSGFGTARAGVVTYTAGGETPDGGPTAEVHSLQFTAGALDPTLLDANGTPASLPVPLAGVSLVSANGLLYALGGQNLDPNNPAASTSVYTAQVDGFGGLASGWTSLTSLPDARANAAAVIADGAIYLLGGEDPARGALNTIVRADILPNGALATWSTLGTTLPAVGGTTPRTQAAAVAFGGEIYLAGGLVGGAAVFDVESVSIQLDGTLGTWTPAPPMSVARSGLGLVLANGELTALGGDGAGSVEQAPVFDDGTVGSWLASPSLTVPRSAGGAAVSSGVVSVFGGVNAGAAVASVESAAVGAWFSNGPWTTPGALTKAWYDIPSVFYNGRAYFVFGTEGSGLSTEIGMVAVGPTGIPGTTATAQGAGVYPLPRYHEAAAAYDGYLYLFGGCLDWSSSCTAGAPLLDVSAAPILSDGTIGTFVSTNQLPSPAFDGGLDAAAAVVHNGRVYIVQGGEGSAGFPLAGGYGSLLGAGVVSEWSNFTNVVPNSQDVYTGQTSFGVFDRGVIYSGFSRVDGFPGGIDFTAVLGWALDGGAPEPPFLAQPLGPAGHSNSSIANPMAVAYEERVIWVGGQPFGDTAAVQGAARETDGGLGAVNNGVYLPNSAGRAASNVSLFNGQILSFPMVSSDLNVYASDLRGSGVLGNWQTSSSSSGLQSLPGGRYATASAATGSGSVYLAGGVTVAGVASSVVHGSLSPISDGGGATWSVAATLPTPLRDSAAAIGGNTLYVSGGSDDGGMVHDDVWAAALLPDGGLGSFTAVTPLPGPRQGHAMAAWQNMLYVVAGDDGSGNDLATAVAAPILPGGALGSWTSTSSITLAASTEGIPAGRTHATAVTHGGNLYLVGGIKFGGAVTREVVHAPMLTDGGGLGAWVGDSQLTVSRAGAAAGAWGDRLYVAGGCSGPGEPCASVDGGPAEYALAQVTTASFYADGTLGEWNEAATLPSPRADSAGALVNGNLYVIGGSTPTGSPNAGVVATTVRSTPLHGRLVLPIDLGTDVASVDGVLIEPDGGDPSRTGTFDVAARVAAGDAGFGPWIALGNLTAGVASGSVAAGPVRFVELRVDLDDSVDEPLDRGSERDLDSVQVLYTPVGTSSSSSSSSSAASSAAAASAVGSSSSTGAVSSVTSSAGSSAAATSSTGSTNSAGTTSSTGSTNSAGTTSTGSTGSTGGSSNGSTSSTSSTGSNSTASTSSVSTSGSSGSSSLAATSGGSNNTSSSGSGSASLGTTGGHSGSTIGGGSSGGSGLSSSASGASGSSPPPAVSSSSSASAAAGGSSGAGSGSGSSSVKAGSVDALGCNSAGSSLAPLALLALPFLRRRRPRWAAASLALALVATPVLASAKKPRIAISQFRSALGVDERLSDVVTSQLAAKVQTRTGYSVVSPADIQAQLGLDKTRQLMGCTDGSCMAELAGALGVDYLISGSLAKVGTSIAFDAALIDTGKCSVIRRYSNRIKGGSDEEFLDEAERAVTGLFPAGSSLPGDTTVVGNSASLATTTGVAANAPTAVPAERPDAWQLSVGVASELTAAGGWASLAFGRTFADTFSASVVGHFTFSKYGGFGLEGTWVPLFASSWIHPLVGLEVPVLLASSVMVGVEPRLAVEFKPTLATGIEVGIPFAYYFVAPTQERPWYLLGQVRASYAF